MKDPAGTPIDEATELQERALAVRSAARWVEAEELARQALAIFEHEDGPSSPDVANLHNLLAEAAEAQGRYTEAEASARRAGEIMERLGSRCRGPEADAIRGEALARRGSALRVAGKYQEAETWLVRALALAELSCQGVAVACNNLAVLYKYTGHFDEAERLYRRALLLVAEDSAEAATLYHNLGGLEHARGRFAAGEEDARRAWEIRRELRGADHPETLVDACAYAACCKVSGAMRNPKPFTATPCRGSGESSGTSTWR